MVLRESEQRFDYIDIAKGLGMLTIVWGHVFLDGLSNAIVFSFHIPLFFFLSGLVFDKKRYASFGIFIKKRLKGLIFPYIVFSVITWMAWAVYSYNANMQVESFWMPLLQTFIAQGSDGYMLHNVPLWFVMCLFSVEVIYYFLARMNDWVVMLICIVLCVLGVLSTKVTFFDFSTLPWSLDVAMMAMPFYAAGSLLTKYIPHFEQVEIVQKYKIWNAVLFALGAVAVYLGAKYNGYVSMGRAHLGPNPLGFYATAFCGIIVVMLLSIAVSQSGSHLISWLKWIGRNSFRMMAVHNPIKGVVIIVIGLLLQSLNINLDNNDLQLFLTFVITILISISIVWLIEWGMKKTLGRNSLLK